MFIYLSERERQRQRENERGRAREREGERIPSMFGTDSREPDAGLDP